MDNNAVIMVNYHCIIIQIFCATNIVAIIVYILTAEFISK